MTLTCVASNAAADSVTAMFNEALVPVPAQAHIAAPLQVTQGAAATASVSNASSSATYQWTITGALFTGASQDCTSAAGSAVSFTVSATGNIATAGTPSITLVASSLATITAPAFVTAGKAGHSASVAAQSGSTYAWTINNGTLTPPATASTITFTAESGAQLTLSCIATNSAGTPVTGTLNVAIAPAPIAPVISAAAKVTQGNNNARATVSNASPSFTYSWAIVGGTFNVLNAPGSSTAAGATVSYTAGTSASLQLTCTATNAATDTAASSTTVTLITPPLAPTFTGAQTVSQGYSANVSINNVPSNNTGNSQLTYQWAISGGMLSSSSTATSANVGR